MKHLTFFVTIILLSIACSNSKTVEADKKASSQTHTIIEKERLIDSFYTKILLSDCHEIHEGKYTEENTKITNLEAESYQDCFGGSSGLTCGAGNGSCGDEIFVYKKNKNKYDQVYISCGFDFQQSGEAHFGINSFTFRTRYGYKKKVSWNGKAFEEKIIEVNGLKYKPIKAIAERTQKEENYFVLDQGIECFHTRIRIEPFQISPTIIAELYTVLFPSKTYFIMLGDQILFQINDIKSIEIIRGNKSYYDLKIMDRKNLIMTKDTSYIEPIYYTFSPKKRIYAKKSKVKK